MTTVNRYNNAKIYVIRSHLTEKIYIGSTCESTLARRMVQHRTNFKRFTAGNGRCTSSREMLIYADNYIELLESFPCNNKDQLHQREGFHIRANRLLCVNIRIEGRTTTEYRSDNRELLKEKQKQYTIDNPEKIKQINKQYRINNVEKIKQYYNDNKELIRENQKQYRIDNSEKIKQIYKQYYKNNLEKIKIRKSINIYCSYCKKNIKKNSKSVHIRSLTHIKNYKKSYLECFGEVFSGTLDNEDY